MNTYTLESFISFCDDMQISNESFNFQSIKSKIVTIFSKLILLIESKVKKMKDSKFKSTLLKLLSRAKIGLSKSKSLREYNPEMVDELNKEAEDIKEEYDNVSQNGDNGNHIDEQINMVNDIINGKINRKQVERKIDQMIHKYGKDSFDSYPVKRKDKSEWNEEHLHELENLSNSGASSIEFYLYMAEVSDYVHSPMYKIKKKVGGV